jgi:hypothetical protein
MGQYRPKARSKYLKALANRGRLVSERSTNKQQALLPDEGAGLTLRHNPQQTPRLKLGIRSLEAMTPFILGYTWPAPCLRIFSAHFGVLYGSDVHSIFVVYH